MRVLAALKNIAELRHRLSVSLADQPSHVSQQIPGHRTGKIGFGQLVQITEKAFVQDRQFRHPVMRSLFPDRLEIAQDFLRAQYTLLRNALEETRCRLGSHDARHYFLAGIRRRSSTRHHFRHALPRPAVGQLFQAGIQNPQHLPVQIILMVLDEADDPAIQAFAFGPSQPFGYRRLEIIYIEARHQSRIQIGKLVLVPFIDRRNDTASFRKRTPGQFLVQSQIHDGLQDFRPCPVQLVQEKNYGLPVQRKPVRWHELRLSRLLVLMRDAYQIPGVAHLAEEQRNHLLPLRAEIAFQNLRLADSMPSHQHHILGIWHGPEQFFQLFCIDTD